jgi:elongator complex protein 3
MFKELFSNQDYQPDQIKFYPTVVTKGSLLYKWYKQGKYQPYTDQELENLIADCKAIVPPYVRIIRLIRDIPGESIVAGNLVTNLRQVMQQRGVKCNCIRCREIKDRPMDVKKARLININYPASNGVEYFLSYNSPDGKDLYGFCRLRLTPNSSIAPAIIRELHVYGQLVPVGHIKKVQHSGLGKKLMKEAEKIARKNKTKEMAIISGIGVRGYYKKLGYKLKDTYMKKALL